MRQTASLKPASRLQPEASGKEPDQEVTISARYENFTIFVLSGLASFDVSNVIHRHSQSIEKRWFILRRFELDNQ
jgi:hypothetical protein